MKSNKTHQNTFSQGMSSDIEKEYMPNQSYRYAKNKSLVFNRDHTMAVKDKQGNVLSFDIEDAVADLDLAPVGYAKYGDKAVLFSRSTTGTASEIGLVIVDGNGVGSYKTLFNDDASVDKLNFRFDFPIEAVVYYETDNYIRVYWGEGTLEDANPFRTFTFKRRS